MDRVVLQDVHGSSLNGGGAATEEGLLEEFEADGAVAGLDQRVSLPGVPGVKGMGWLRDYPDIRDYTPETERVRVLLEGTSVPEMPSLAPSVDLRQWCSAIEDQGELGSCTAQAGVGLLEYFERKAFGKHINGSKRFLYKATRQLGGFKGDSGAFLRTTMGAMALFGVPPEKYWRYSIPKFDKEPSPFVYSFGQSYQSTTYYRLDPAGTSKQDVLDSIKSHLVSQIPSMFGFTVYESLYDADMGKIPFPAQDEYVLGGHAVVAVGYDDSMKIKNLRPGGIETTGAFLIRNSWGTTWGDSGYGWIPYEYVLHGLADDWWVLLAAEWVDTAQFKT